MNLKVQVIKNDIKYGDKINFYHDENGVSKIGARINSIVKIVENNYKADTFYIYIPSEINEKKEIFIKRTFPKSSTKLGEEMQGCRNEDIGVIGKSAHKVQKDKINRKIKKSLKKNLVNKK